MKQIEIGLKITEVKKRDILNTTGATEYHLSIAPGSPLTPAIIDVFPLYSQAKDRRWQLICTAWVNLYSLLNSIEYEYEYPENCFIRLRMVVE